MDQTKESTFLIILRVPVDYNCTLGKKEIWLPPNYCILFLILNTVCSTHLIKNSLGSLGNVNALMTNLEGKKKTVKLVEIIYSIKSTSSRSKHKEQWIKGALKTPTSSFLKGSAVNVLLKAEDEEGGPRLQFHH